MRYRKMPITEKLKEIAEKATDSVVNVHQLRDTAIAISSNAI